jgi:hypothetical protein
VAERLEGTQTNNPVKRKPKRLFHVGMRLCFPTRRRGRREWLDGDCRKTSDWPKVTSSAADLKPGR